MTRSRLMVLFIVSTTFLTQCSANPLEIKTMYGKVLGKTETTAFDKDVNVWYSIPYARPPLAELRFKDPSPPVPWKDVLDVTGLPNACIQQNPFGNRMRGFEEWSLQTNISEDCLYISVITPNPTPKKAAVLFWIYGGGFSMGSTMTSLYDYKALAALGDVIIVAPQYRVGSLGFLYSHGLVSNAGLKDQLLALQWTNDNIGFFGGDPARITLFGESAGGASVGYHLLSSLSAPLFARAILQSGTPNTPWASLDRKKSVQNGLLLAKKVGCGDNEQITIDVIECLQKVDIDKLLGDDMTDLINFNPFWPVNDENIVEGDVRQNMENMRIQENKQILIGSNKDEGQMFTLIILNTMLNFTDKSEINAFTLKSIVKGLLQRERFSEAVSDVIVNQYIQWKDPSDTSLNIESLSKLLSDFWFTCDINRFTNKLSERNEVYKYYFTHKTNSRESFPDWFGATHGDEMYYLFGHPFNSNKNYTSEEKELSDRIISFFTNFAKTGNPNKKETGELSYHSWPMYSLKEKSYLIMDGHSFDVDVGVGPRIDECAFWSKTVPLISKLEESANECKIDEIDVAITPGNVYRTTKLISTTKIHPSDKNSFDLKSYVLNNVAIPIANQADDSTTIFDYKMNATTTVVKDETSYKTVRISTSISKYRN